MSRIGIPVRRLRLGAVAPSAQGWIGGGITGYRAASPPRRRISDAAPTRRACARDPVGIPGRRLTRCAMTCWSPT